MVQTKIGEKAPEFKGVTQRGETISITDFKGKKLILYFYPKDNTSGCTAEACNLSENYNKLQAAGYEVVGVSPDSIKSHQKFSEKHQLPFPLIADTEKEILKAYGVWGEKKMYGKTYMGVKRTTFIINEDGKIEQIIDKVETKDHTNQILNNK